MAARIIHPRPALAQARCSAFFAHALLLRYWQPVLALVFASALCCWFPAVLVAHEKACAPVFFLARIRGKTGGLGSPLSGFWPDGRQRRTPMLSQLPQRHNWYRKIIEQRTARRNPSKLFFLLRNSTSFLNKGIFSGATAPNSTK
jgi:hypothetical protein